MTAGEDDDTAAERERAEEPGIEGVTPTYVASGTHEDEHARERCRVYRVVHDGPYRFDDGEVAEARLVDRAGLTELIATGQVLPGSVAILLPLIDVP